MHKTISRITEKPTYHNIEHPVYIERMYEVPVERERVIDVPLTTIRENIQLVEKIIEKEVVYDAIIEKRVEVIVEKIIEVPVEKIIEVPVII